MKKGLFVICLCLCVFILFGCANNSAASKKIISRCSNAWHVLGSNNQDIKPIDCEWYYRQYSDITSLTQTAFKEWEDKPTANDLYWLPKSGYFVAIGSIIALFGDDDSYIGCYYTKDSDIYFAYGDRIISNIKGTDVRAQADRDIAKAQNNVNKIYFKAIMQAETNNSYVSFEKYDIEKDTSYCKLTDSQKSQIK